MVARLRKHKLSAYSTIELDTLISATKEQSVDEYILQALEAKPDKTYLSTEFWKVFSRSSHH
jgi:hypothetical protein